MSERNTSSWAAAALLLAGLALPMAAQAAKYNNIHCYGSTSMRAISSNPFSADSDSEVYRRFKRAIFERGWEEPYRVRCEPDVSPEQRARARHNLHNNNAVVEVLDVPPLAGQSPGSARPEAASPPPTAPAKTEAPSTAKAREPAQDPAVRAAQNQMDKSVSVALADALRTVPNASDCRMVESPPKVTTGYGPTREDALSQAMARTSSCKVLTTHCLENTKTEFTKEGRPKVAGKFWDCRLSYSCGETQKACTNKPAAASKQ